MEKKFFNVQNLLAVLLDHTTIFNLPQLLPAVNGLSP